MTESERGLTRDDHGNAHDFNGPESVLDVSDIKAISDGLKFGWGFTSQETVDAWDRIKSRIGVK